MIDIFVPIMVVAKQSVRVRINKKTKINKKNAAFFHRDSRVEKNRGELILFLNHHIPKEPIAAPVGEALTFTFPWTMGRLRQGDDTQWRTKRPDVDNLVKQINDCLQWCQYVADDSHICFSVISKVYGDTPGVRVVLWNLERDGLCPIDQMADMTQGEANGN